MARQDVLVILIIIITRNLYCATKCPEQTQQRRPMQNGYMSHDQDLVVVMGDLNAKVGTNAKV